MGRQWWWQTALTRATQVHLRFFFGAIYGLRSLACETWLAKRPATPACAFTLLPPRVYRCATAPKQADTVRADPVGSAVGASSLGMATSVRGHGWWRARLPPPSVYRSATAPKQADSVRAVWCSAPRALRKAAGDA